MIFGFTFNVAFSSDCLLALALAFEREATRNRKEQHDVECVLY